MDEREEHGMLPGTHERPGGAECRCGQEWSYWEDMCLTQHKAKFPERYPQSPPPLIPIRKEEQ
jgi:hypothetical protein